MSDSHLTDPWAEYNITERTEGRTDESSDAQISHVREYKPVWRMYYILWATNSVIIYRINKLIYFLNTTHIFI